MINYTQGWIKIHRHMLEWRWYNDVNVKAVFLHLLLTAVYDNAGAYGYVLQSGQLITTIPRLANEVGLTQQSTRTALNKLKRTGEITTEVTNKFTLVTIVNYRFWQGSDFEANRQATDKQQTSNIQLTDEQQTSNRQATRLKKESKKERIKESKNVRNASELKVIRNSFNNFDQRCYTEEEIKERLKRKKEREAKM